MGRWAGLAYWNSNRVNLLAMGGMRLEQFAPSMTPGEAVALASGERLPAAARQRPMGGRWPAPEAEPQTARTEQAFGSFRVILRVF